MTITEEKDVTTTQDAPAQAAPEGLPFTYLSGFPGLHGGGNVGEAFDSAMEQARSEADAALAEERAALWAASQRMHTRLDIYQHGRTVVLVPMPEPAPGPPVAEPEPEPAEPLPVLPEAQEEALGNFLAAHDAEDTREVEATPDAATPSEVQVQPGVGVRTGDAPEAEPGTEEEAAPAAEQDEAPAPVAEPSEPAPQDDPAGD